MPSVQSFPTSGGATAGSTFLATTQDHIQSLWQAAALPAGGVAGTASAFTATVVPAPTALVQGMGLYFQPHLNCASGATLKINGGAAVPLYRRDGSAVVAGDLVAGEDYTLLYRAAAGPLPARWVVTSLPTAGGRAAMGLGTMATQMAAAVAITGGVIAGLSALGVGVASPAAPLHVRGPGPATPSLSASGGVALLEANADLGIQIGMYPSAGMYLQAKRVSNDGTSWPIVLNPLGGNVGIGTTVPSSRLTVNGAITATLATLGSNGATSAILALNTAGSYDRQIMGMTSGVLRWNVIPGTSSPESSGNLGSDFTINRHADNGDYISTPLFINRATGITTLETLALFNKLAVAQGGTGASTASGARTNLGLGSLATQNSDNVGITGGTVGGLTAVQAALGSFGSMAITAASGAQGGLFTLAKPASGTTLVSDVVVDVSGDNIRFWDGGSARGWFLPLREKSTIANVIDRANHIGTMPASALTGSATLDGLDINGAAGSFRSLVGRTAGVARMALRLADNGAESGSNAGSDLRVVRFDDAGGALATALRIERATGLTTLEALTVTGAIQQGGTDVVNTSRIPILRSYTVGTVPSAASNTQGVIFVSNGTSNKRLAVSDGTNWRWPDGAIVS